MRNVKRKDKVMQKISIKDFAKLIDGRQYDYNMYTPEEIQLAKDNGIVIVYGMSDDLVEMEGAICDEGDCWQGGLIHVKAIAGGGMFFHFLPKDAKIKMRMEILFRGHMMFQ